MQPLFLLFLHDDANSNWKQKISGEVAAREMIPVPPEEPGSGLQYYFYLYTRLYFLGFGLS